MSKIMLVEDDFALAMATEYALQSEGYQVVCADNLQKARGILDESVDLVLLDLMLPDGNGYSFCKEIRDGGFEMPVIFLTAVSDEANIVQGLELGADDYVTKPYRVKELMSRIAANIRRYERNAGRSKKVYEFGKHKFLPEEFRLLCEDKVVECTASEMRLLKELVMNGDVVLSRNTLLERLYDVDGAFIDDNTLSVYLKRLRDKLGKDADYIETVRGVGYRFVKNRNK
ncbi:MAG: response regulator transcription factor [Lachnospiraceae bacterium]|nr:response regulator transcription factor [Lachnospiraceae bacterium]